ncbi:dTDP-4-dehydrorhamnose 3,5-epimerase [Aliiroseovarius sp. S1339]|uniref:dTDP-4-dehydrorhamnose 3,5-epimerase n=1 Tax=Aliiroseovarius sp. S1339 TaxID=2936990 RepID=UPI0020BEE44C|nr:dTDP-4-dehydrorhamnose 3,5-epimerase [Aliiroseovarius sp. S1339]MCK8465074.1 dTDP-4-dehydrorhamnose 3,5-epimerase [Aliiroseovarius sp. S1339]
MKFKETPLKGAFVIDLEEIADDRGHFARAFCAEEFEAHGLKPSIAQINLSFNEKKGTIRGLHYQEAPAAEAKFLRCISGAIYDVIVDLRPDSPTYRQHFGIELSAENRTAIYVPEMFAHGYLALTDGAQAYYSASEFYTPGVEGGLRYDDPALAIDWPIPVTIVSEKDAQWPLISD